MKRILGLSRVKRSELKACVSMMVFMVVVMVVIILMISTMRSPPLPPPPFSPPLPSPPPLPPPPAPPPPPVCRYEALLQRIRDAGGAAFGESDDDDDDDDNADETAIDSMDCVAEVCATVEVSRLFCGARACECDALIAAPGVVERSVAI